MARTPLVITQYGGDDAGFLPDSGNGLWQTPDVANGNIITDMSKISLFFTNRVAFSRRIRLTATISGQVLIKDFPMDPLTTVPPTLVLSDLDLSNIWGRHVAGSSFMGQLFLDYPDSAANTDVFVAVVRHPQRRWF